MMEQQTRLPPREAFAVTKHINRMRGARSADRKPEKTRFRPHVDCESTLPTSPRENLEPYSPQSQPESRPTSRRRRPTSQSWAPREATVPYTHRGRASHLDAPRRRSAKDSSRQPLTGRSSFQQQGPNLRQRHNCASRDCAEVRCASRSDSMHRNCNRARALSSVYGRRVAKNELALTSMPEHQETLDQTWSSESTPSTPITTIEFASDDLPGENHINPAKYGYTSPMKTLDEYRETVTEVPDDELDASLSSPETWHEEFEISNDRDGGWTADSSRNSESRGGPSSPTQSISGQSQTIGSCQTSEGAASIHEWFSTFLDDEREESLVYQNRSDGNASDTSGTPLDDNSDTAFNISPYTTPHTSYTFSHRRFECRESSQRILLAATIDGDGQNLTGSIETAPTISRQRTRCRSGSTATGSFARSSIISTGARSSDTPSIGATSLARNSMAIAPSLRGAYLGQEAQREQSDRSLLRDKQFRYPSRFTGPRKCKSFNSEGERRTSDSEHPESSIRRDSQRMEMECTSYRDSSSDTLDLILFDGSFDDLLPTLRMMNSQLEPAPDGGASCFDTETPARRNSGSIIPPLPPIPPRRTATIGTLRRPATPIGVSPDPGVEVEATHRLPQDDHREVRRMVVQPGPLETTQDLINTPVEHMAPPTHIQKPSRKGGLVKKTAEKIGSAVRKLAGANNNNTAANATDANISSSSSGFRRSLRAHGFNCMGEIPSLHEFRKEAETRASMMAATKTDPSG